MGSFKFSCYYLQYVPLSEPFDFALFEVLEASNTVLYFSFLKLSKELPEGPSWSGKPASG